jgi:hypothetical protein
MKTNQVAVAPPEPDSHQGDNHQGDELQGDDEEDLDLFRHIRLPKPRPDSARSDLYPI